MPGSCVVTDAKNLRYLPGTFVWILLYHISQLVLINITTPPTTFMFFQALISIPELLIPTIRRPNCGTSLTECGVDLLANEIRATTAGIDLSRPLSVDTKMALSSHSAGSLNECGICGPEKAIWVPDVSETGEPLIEPTSEHGLTIKTDPVDTFWIQCDCCEKWFHGNCVDVEEYQDVLIDKFHCSSCAATKGPTIMKNVLVRHRYAFDDLSQADLPPEIGTEVWIAKFIETESDIPPPSDDHAIICKNGFEFMDDFDRRGDWKKIYLIEQARGLELRVPEKEENFGLHTIVEIFGTQFRRPFRVDTIDVYRQVTHSMSIGAFYDKMVDKERPRLYNILSLEFMRQIVEVLEEHRRNKPEVALFCLCGMAGSYTDFHIDFGGSSVWYHIYEGRKIFYIVEPTDEYLDLFEEYQRSETKTEVFFGDLLPTGALRRKEVGTEDKYLFPHFELVNWYAARSFILEHIREANDEGNRADKYMMEAALALMPRLKEWMRRDKEAKANFTHESFNDVLVKLQKEINKQQVSILETLESLYFD
ncbi:unnamed protein product [Heligmosomoides polygyrus]|uniref:JmjC domain-containing protein n=1 Tax=Heligmosomoides polygyrus TaxID=6339 RepID=A0A3P8C6Q5_HELPZ|nr:unnamed protein product [Heligmosomoides polygyrus]